jgi:NADH dehydrogenase
VLAYLQGQPLRHYQHSYAGSVASLGLYRGVAEVYGIRLRGIVAWFMHRTYHLSRMPTFNRKVRILADWTTALLFHREVVALGQINDPKADFVRANAAS